MDKIPRFKKGFQKYVSFLWRRSSSSSSSSQGNEISAAAAEALPSYSHIAAFIAMLEEDQADLLLLLHIPV